MKKLLFFMMFFVFNMTVFASHLDLEVIPNVYSNQVDLNTSVFFSSNQKKYIMDSRVVYCTSPGVDIMTREYSLTDLSLSSISSSILDKMKLIGYYGYDYPGHQTDRFFMASQELIWELLNQDVGFTTGRYNAGSVINIDYEKNQIMSLVDEHYILPSFAGSSYNEVYGSSIELVDTNNVLSNFDVVSSNNSVFIDGNRLIINVDSLDSDIIRFIKKKYDNLETMYYKAPDSQDFMFFRPDDVSFDIGVSSYLPKSNISVYKTGDVLVDYSDGFVYENKGLTGVVFDVFAARDVYYGSELVYHSGDLVSEFSTVDGFGFSDDLPDGNYILKEVSTLDGYFLDDTEYSLVLNGLERKSYMVNLNNERQRIVLHLQKVGEEFEEVVLDKGIYREVPLENIEFGLYSRNPIYSFDDNLLVQKDVLLGVFKTDHDGVINVSLDVPFGTYYVKEISSLEGYKVDPNIYEFSVLTNGDDTNILITKEPIVNELIKGDLVIHKVDIDGNNLCGAEFKIFDDFDNLIYDGLTDELGMIRISDLGYGKYHFYETSAPDGFYKDDKLYEFFITDDGEVINIKVVNEKLPVTSNIYAVPKRFSTIGLGFGLATLSLAVVNDKKYKNN